MYRCSVVQKKSCAGMAIYKGVELFGEFMDDRAAQNLISTPIYV
jgi:hypothetical protein